MQTPQKFLRRPEVETLTGIKTTAIYEMIAQGRFPKPVKLAPRLAVWIEAEIVAWQQARIAERDGRAA